jgi:hypothetical protein
MIVGEEEHVGVPGAQIPKEWSPKPDGLGGKAAAFQSSQRLGQGLCSGP